VNWGNQLTAMTKWGEVKRLRDKFKLWLTRSCDELCLTSLCQTCQTHNPLFFLLTLLSTLPSQRTVVAHRTFVAKSFPVTYCGCPIVRSVAKSFVLWLPHCTLTLINDSHLNVLWLPIVRFIAKSFQECTWLPHCTLSSTPSSTLRTQEAPNLFAQSSMTSSKYIFHVLMFRILIICNENRHM
jgi:hypothetical protein